MPKLWFCYSTVNGLDSDEPYNSPYSITWNLGRYLRRCALECGYQFEYRNLDDKSPADLFHGDVVVGHTWWDGGFMDIALDSPAYKFILQPYQHYMVSEGDIPRLKQMFAKADRLLLITGQYWWDTMKDSPFADWQTKATRIDMAVNPNIHPLSKISWNEPGKRKFLAMGTDRPYKGLDEVAHLMQMSGAHLGYFGNALLERFAHVPSFTHFGGALLNEVRQAHITSEYDFFITLGRADANPTTLLEAACWGLIPLCNPRSGYWPEEPFIGLLDPGTPDADGINLAVLEGLQDMKDRDLYKHQRRIRDYVIRNHSWEKFNRTVWAEIMKVL